MRSLRLWQHTLRLWVQNDPPRLVAAVMSLLAVPLVLVGELTHQWPYLVLGLSYGVGTALLALVCELVAPSTQSRATQLAALILLVMSINGFVHLVPTL